MQLILQPYSRKNLLVALLLGLFLNACQSIVGPNEPVTQIPISSSETEAQSTPAAEPITNNETTETAPGQIPTVIHHDNLWHRITDGFALQEFYLRPEVESQLVSYARRQNYFDLVSQRAEPFLYWIVNEVERRGLPLELALLPMVESTFNPRARSGDRAVGLWQFLANTGEGYGLQQDFWYDGRRDPYASTRAALDYLESLHKRFNEDWLLALAAYNTGGGNLLRAIRRHGTELESSEFWDLPLARETRSHVPKLLAISRVISNPADYEIELPAIANEEPLVAVDIGQQIELALIASTIEMETEEVQALNPGYLQWATHPNSPQSIRIPKAKAAQLAAGIAAMDPQEFVTWEHYRIQSGDTLSSIARKINTTVPLLRTVNNIKGSQIIAGRDLLIPRGLSAGDSRLANLQLPTARLPASVPDTYTVQRGDNLWTIARRFDLYSVDIAAWNGFDLDELMQPGQILDFGFASLASETASTLPQANLSGSTYHIVRRGDSPAKIASQLGISMQDVLAWNGLSEGEIIYPGQRLRIAPPAGELN